VKSNDYVKELICFELAIIYQITFSSLLYPFCKISLANETVWYNALIKIQT